MDLFFLLFQAAPALQMIFKLSYIPQREDFKELTPGQYEAMYAKVPEEELKTLADQRVLAFLPDDIQVYNRLINVYGDDLMILGEDEIANFEKVSEMIERYCAKSGRTFESLTDKLVYMAQVLPDVFSKGTPYAIHTSLKRPRK